MEARHTPDRQGYIAAGEVATAPEIAGGMTRGIRPAPADGTRKIVHNDISNDNVEGWSEKVEL